MFTGFFALTVMASWMVFRRLRRVRSAEGGLGVMWYAGAAAAYTTLFVLGMMLALLIGIVHNGSG